MKTAIQDEGMDDDLRNALWNVLHIFLWSKALETGPGLTSNSPLKSLYHGIWHAFFRLPVDQIEEDEREVIETLRLWCLTKPWLDVYDLVEFLAQCLPGWVNGDQFIRACNTVLEQENSGYRFISGKLSPISTPVEMESMEQALRESNPFAGVRAHLQSALEKLSDRKSPDYRNSIKEAICAVEGVCQVITEKPGATLGEAVKVIESRIPIHTAFKAALEKLYGYTSDADGIRHAMSDESSPSFSDAKFMLVAASGFVNYMIGKAAEVGLKLKPLKKG